MGLVMVESNGLNVVVGLEKRNSWLYLDRLFHKRWTRVRLNGCYASLSFIISYYVILLLARKSFSVQDHASPVRFDSDSTVYRYKAFKIECPSSSQQGRCFKALIPVFDVCLFCSL